MPDYPESVALARGVETAISAQYPSTRVEWPDSSDFYHGTIVDFVPKADASAPLMLLVNFNQSYSLLSGRFVIAEDEETAGSDLERVELIVAAIDEIARNGIERSWLDRLIGRNDRVAPWTA